jgi:hypothetical protein
MSEPSRQSNPLPPKRASMKEIFDVTDERQLRSLYQALWDKSMTDPDLKRIVTEAIESDCERRELFAGAWIMGACYAFSEVLRGSLKQKEQSPWQSNN